MPIHIRSMGDTHHADYLGIHVNAYQHSVGDPDVPSAETGEFSAERLRHPHRIFSERAGKESKHRVSKFRAQSSQSSAGRAGDIDAV